MVEGRTSDSPYIKHVWRGHIVEDYTPICPADPHWNLLFMKQNNQWRVAAEGALTHNRVKQEVGGSEFLVIQFQLGAYMPHLTPSKLVNQATTLPQAASQSFWVKGAAMQLPTYENVEVFVEWLMRDNVLVCDELISQVMAGGSTEFSERTIRRRFLHTTGMTPSKLRQIKRARHAVSLLEQGCSLADTALIAGYADQPHMTRSIQHYFGQTPMQLTRLEQPEYCPKCSRRSLFIDLCYWCRTKIP